jgi:hypothetical protein
VRVRSPACPPSPERAEGRRPTNTFAGSNSTTAEAGRECTRRRRRACIDTRRQPRGFTPSNGGSGARPHLRANVLLPAWLRVPRAVLERAVVAVGACRPVDCPLREASRIALGIRVDFRPKGASVLGRIAGRQGLWATGSHRSTDVCCRGAGRAHATHAAFQLHQPRQPASQRRRAPARVPTGVPAPGVVTQSRCSSTSFPFRGV